MPNDDGSMSSVDGSLRNIASFLVMVIVADLKRPASSSSLGSRYAALKALNRLALAFPFFPSGIISSNALLRFRCADPRFLTLLADADDALRCCRTDFEASSSSESITDATAGCMSSDPGSGQKKMSISSFSDLSTSGGGSPSIRMSCDSGGAFTTMIIWSM